MSQFVYAVVGEYQMLQRGRPVLEPVISKLGNRVVGQLQDFESLQMTDVKFEVRVVIFDA